MTGKREFCPGEKCKNAWKYANRTGKLKNKENQKNIPKGVPNKIGKFPTIVGQLTRVTTTADQCVRIQIDIPVERVDVDTIQYLNRSVVLAFIEENEEKNKEYKPKDSGKERFFS